MTLRAAFNLDRVSAPDRLSLLIHGAYGAGKTHLEGDFLRWAKERGPIAFLNIKGEDGHASLAPMGLGPVGYTVDSLDEYTEAMEAFKGLKLYGLAADSLPALYRLVMVKLMGSVRYPDARSPQAGGDGDRSKWLWGQLNMLTQGAVLTSRSVAQYVMWVSPYDKSEDAISGGQSLTPDLPGKLAHGCAGWFDFVGSMSAVTLGPNNVQRRVKFAPTSAVLTRQRATRVITEDIEIPTGGGGWANIYGAISKAFESTNTKG